MVNVLLFLSRLIAPTDRPGETRIRDAREALDYWSRRESDLAWHRRAHRREARRMIATWRAELVGIHLERLGLASLAHGVAPLLDTHGRSAAGHARSLALSSARRTAIGRRILFAAAGLAVASAVLLVVAAGVAAHLAGVL
jgi:hypothetical protein